VILLRGKAVDMLNLFSLEGKRAIVTGGAGGLGASIAEALAQACAAVVILDSSEATESVAANFRSTGLGVEGLRSDLRDRSALRSAFSGALEILGGAVDVLVNSAGIQRRASSEHFPADDWDAVIDINLTTTFFMSQLAGRNMLLRESGKIINVASVMSFFGGSTIPAYAASKGGVAQLTKALSNDWAARGICVNAIAPGYMDTPMNTALLADKNRTKEILGRVPAGRWGQGEDVKGISVFLASQASDFISGAVIPVDGGYSAR